MSSGPRWGAKGGKGERTVLEAKGGKAGDGKAGVTAW